MWKTVKLGDVCDLSTGGTPSRTKPEYFDNGGVKWLVSGDINQREIFDCEGRITQEGLKNSNAKFLPLDSVLIALNGQGKTRGTVALLRTNATCNQSLVAISPKVKNYLDTKYIFYVLDGMYEKIRKLTGDSGNDRRGLNMPLIRNIPFSYPPLAEQQRIVAKLDAAFAEIDTAIEITRQKEDGLKALKSSILANELENKDG
jgi:type I restriction enzyme, S subunit